MKIGVVLNPAAGGGRMRLEWPFFEKALSERFGAFELRTTTGSGQAPHLAADLAAAGCDVVIAGGGCAGLTAAIRARDLGATVLVVDQNFDLGGRMLHSGAFVSLGGGDPVQKRDIKGESDKEGFVTMPPVESPADAEPPEPLFPRSETCPQLAALTKRLMAKHTFMLDLLPIFTLPLPGAPSRLHAGLHGVEWRTLRTTAKNRQGPSRFLQAAFRRGKSGERG